MSTVNAAPAEKKSAGLLATLANNSKQYGIVGALVVIVLVFEFLTKGVLLKPNSFVSLIQQNAYVIILAIGMVMVIIATHIDLSVGSIVAFVGGVCAILMERQGVNWMLAILISLVVGLIIGCWQGFWVAYVGIPGFITTLAGMEFEMDAIAACFIGGTAVTGGVGTIPGAVVGALVMGVINQGLSIMGVDTAVVKTIKGLVLLGAVAVDILSKRKKS